MRYEAGKVRLGEILKRYSGTMFTVAAEGPPTAILRRPGLTVKGRPGPPGSLLVEIVPGEGQSLAGPAAVSLAKEPVVPGLRLLPESEAGGTSRFRFRIAWGPSPASGEVLVPVDIRCRLQGPGGGTREESGVLLVPSARGDSGDPSADEGSARGRLALVGGAIDVELAHLCSDQGCVEHLRASLEALGEVASVRAMPGLEDPRAVLFLRAGRPIDLAGLRQGLLDRGVEVRRLRPRDFGPFRLELELVRRESGSGEPSPCPRCVELALDSVLSLPWVSGVAAGESGFALSLSEREPDLAALLHGLERRGVAPAALWLVPPGTPLPPARPPVAAPKPLAKQGGSEAHPLMRIDLDHDCPALQRLLDHFAKAKWSSGARTLPDVSVLATIGDRQWADLTPILGGLRADGVCPRSISLSGFGDLRIQCEFDHLCGEAELSKPPEAAGGEKKEAKKVGEPFVPQPLRPAPSSKARQAIEKALAGVGWIRDATFLDYHTRPEFNGPRKLLVALSPESGAAVKLEELVRALADSGFPPTSVAVSRLFSGLPFGAPLPGDLPLTARGGKPLPLPALRKPGRPLALVFVSLRCPKWDKYKYEADPRYFRTLKDSVESLKDKVDFAAVSSNPDDALADVAGFLEKAGLEVPLFHDEGGKVRALLNAQITPAPHLYLFDAGGRLRYAGDAHSGFEKPDGDHRDFLGQALERVLSGKLSSNGAAFFNSAKCNCSSPQCKCPKCGCGPSCRCAIGHCKVGF